MNDENLTLEPVGPADGEQLSALARAYHAYDDHPWHAENERAVEQLCQGTPIARAFFLKAGGRRIGFASISFGFSIEVGGLDFFLDEFFIEETARGRGHGTRALALLEEEARCLGANRLCLEAVTENAAAKALYERRGYELHERYLMSKRL